MAKINGKEYTREELLNFSGEIAQLASIEEFRFDAGARRGMKAYRVRNAAGLSFEVIPDMCLDISNLSYKGVNISWLSKTGYAAGNYAAPVLGEFGHYFAGGMLWTCGLKNTGDDYVNENGTFQHAHGRLGITPAENVWQKAYWEGNDYILSLGGEIRDAELCGYNLHITREMKTCLDGTGIEITDTLENLEPVETDYLLLYHFNFGFPFISPQTRFLPGERSADILGRTPKAVQNKETWDVYTEPLVEEEEECFFHHLKADETGMAHFRAENDALGIGACVSFDPELLPILTFWKSVRTGEYVAGIEPGNSYLGGLHDSRKRGVIGRIGGYEKKTVRTRLDFYDL